MGDDERRWGDRKEMGRANAKYARLHEMIGQEQIKGEAEWLFALLAERKPRSILEIGTKHGETLQRMAQCCAPGACLYSIDENAWDRTNADKIRAMGHRAEQFLGNSRSVEAIQWAAERAPFDFIFIDGDHSKLGVESDWCNYRGFSKLIGFHDINGDGCEVRPLWESIKAQYKTREIGLNPHWMGIGVVDFD